MLDLNSRLALGCRERGFALLTGCCVQALPFPDVQRGHLSFDAAVS